MTHNIPQHVAIIPDGNRRWARGNGRDPWIGHDEGAQRIEEIARSARAQGVTHLSLWGSSLENLTKRSLRERAALLDVYERYFDKLIGSDEIMRDEVRINVFGRWREQLPESLCKKLENGIRRTAQHERYFLNFFIAYSGDDDMLGAVRSIVDADLPADAIDGTVLKAHLMTKDLPPVDYMIRTGGEPHLSAGFMMWDMANAQLYFTETLFPDFDAAAFAVALEEYERRARRLGA